MLRFNLLCLAMISAAPLAPLGCPGAQSPIDDDGNLDRGSITTSATGPGSAAVGEQVTLTASATATDGSAVRYAWLQTGGPGVAIQNASAATATFAAPSLASKQTLTFVVTTTDDSGAVGRAQISVEISADPNYKPYQFTPGTGSGGTNSPVADAGANQNVDPNTTVTLDGTKSNGTQLSYSWRQISGTSVTLQNPTTAQPTFTAPAYVEGGDNALVFELGITDSTNRTVTDRVKVTVRNPNVSDRRVKIETSLGDFTIELDPEKAPISTANFLQYVDDGFYDGTIFHRVMPNFVVQGGGFLPGLTQKTTRDPIENEAGNGLKNIRGSVAMARTTDPNSATSQWYVNLKDNSASLDKTASNPGYAVFGTVVEGMDVVDRIAAVQTQSTGGFDDVPVTDVVLRKASRVSTAP